MSQGLTWPWIFGIFAGFIVLNLIAQEAGAEFGKWMRKRREAKDPTTHEQ
jgi:hypothetical protein